VKNIPTYPKNPSSIIYRIMGVLNVLMRTLPEYMAPNISLNRVLAWRKAAKEKYRIRREPPKKKESPFGVKMPQLFSFNSVGPPPAFAKLKGGLKNPFKKPDTSSDSFFGDPRRAGSKNEGFTSSPSNPFGDLVGKLKGGLKNPFEKP
jgi:hypothetical protein